MVTSLLTIDKIGNFILSQIYGDVYTPLNRTIILVIVLLISIMLQAIYEAIYHHERLTVSIREEEQSKQMILQAQLDALRNQARPHFMFNLSLIHI